MAERERFPTKGTQEETDGIIFEGASLRQLAIIFDMDTRDVSRRIGGVMSCGTRRGNPIYRIRDVAAKLVAPDASQVSEAIKTMSPKDLPPQLTREYWAGQHARLKFEENQRDLWRTAEIVEKMGEMLKTIRMSMLLMRDQTERQTELTARQQSIITGLIDGVLHSMADKLIEQFKHEPDRRFDDDEREGEDSDEDL